MARPSTLPTWDSNATNLTPPGSEATDGWGVTQSPAAQVFNWFMYWVGRWIDWAQNTAWGAGGITDDVGVATRDHMLATANTWTAGQTVNVPGLGPALTLRNSGVGPSLSAERVSIVAADALNPSLHVQSNGPCPALVVTGDSQFGGTVLGDLYVAGVVRAPNATRAFVSLAVNAGVITIYSSEGVTGAVVSTSGGTSVEITFTDDFAAAGYSIAAFADASPIGGGEGATNALIATPYPTTLVNKFRVAIFDASTGRLNLSAQSAYLTFCAFGTLA